MVEKLLFINPLSLSLFTLEKRGTKLRVSNTFLPVKVSRSWYTYAFYIATLQIFKFCVDKEICIQRLNYKDDAICKIVSSMLFFETASGYARIWINSSIF